MDDCFQMQNARNDDFPTNIHSKKKDLCCVTNGKWQMASVEQWRMIADGDSK